MVLDIGQSSENGFLSENMSVWYNMVTLRVEMPVFKIMARLPSDIVTRLLVTDRGDLNSRFPAPRHQVI